MDEKLKSRIEKLKTLAERGVGGEKKTAEKKLRKLLDDNDITLEELSEEEAKYHLFKYRGKHEKRLLKQCIYKVMGAADHTAFYRTTGEREKVGIYCTKAQKIEIELEFEFYRNVFYEELQVFMGAFIQAQKIFPEDAPKKDCDDLSELTEEDIRVMTMAEGIERRTRTAMIEGGVG